MLYCEMLNFVYNFLQKLCKIGWIKQQKTSHVTRRTTLLCFAEYPLITIDWWSYKSLLNDQDSIISIYFTYNRRKHIEAYIRNIPLGSVFFIILPFKNTSKVLLKTFSAQFCHGDKAMMYLAIYGSCGRPYLFMFKLTRKRSRYARPKLLKFGKEAMVNKQWKPQPGDNYCVVERKNRLFV